MSNSDGLQAEARQDAHNGHDLSSAIPARKGINASAIPEPTYVPPDPFKKTHARKQPQGHIPRPRNAFILFRCDFVRQKKIPQDVENDHRNISRIAGSVWREMTDVDKTPWVEMAKKEKSMHVKVYPGYRYSPTAGSTTSKKKKRGDVEEEPLVVSRKSDTLIDPRHSTSSIHLPDPHSSLHASTELAKPLSDPARGRKKSRDDSRNGISLISGQEHHLLLWNNTESVPSPRAADLPGTPSFLSLRRSSSCPPGAPRISLSPTKHDDGVIGLLVTRDDLARRPSRVTMYQSSHPLPLSSDLSDQAFVRALGRNNRPVLESGPYSIDPPGDAPGWDCAPPTPWHWTSWENRPQKEPFWNFDDSPYTSQDTQHKPNFTNPFNPGHVSAAISTPSLHSPPLSSGTYSHTGFEPFDTSESFAEYPRYLFTPSHNMTYASTARNDANLHQPITHAFSRMSLSSEPTFGPLDGERLHHYGHHTNPAEYSTNIDNIPAALHVLLDLRLGEEGNSSGIQLP